MNLQRFRQLSAHQRAMIAIAVLLDGHEASLYLSNDSLSGEELASIAEEFASVTPEFRSALAGHHLRKALEDIGERAGEVELPDMELPDFEAPRALAQSDLEKDIEDE